MITQERDWELDTGCIPFLLTLAIECDNSLKYQEKVLSLREKAEGSGIENRN